MGNFAYTFANRVLIEEVDGKEGKRCTKHSAEGETESEISM